ncbi:MAG TPA: MFS transporter [Smithellaceae bacterium]|nr:MFS transporter [Smithellaceae bacterium]HRS83626.1 MFS transporter [Smithellaceae bacterium]HRV44824.1 MFS transporter [Smithellaceae bacterium]
MKQAINTDKLWTKDFVTIAVINAIVFLTHFLLIVTIASYAVDEFHASTDMAGLVAGIFIIGALLGRLGTGRVIEEIGSKKVLIVSTMLFIITSALYFAAVSLTLLIVIRLLHGIVFGTASTATGTIVAQIIPPGRRGEGIGFYSIGAILAVAVGPFIGIFLIHHADFRMIFVLTSLLAAVSFALSFAVNKPVYEKPALGSAAPGERFRLSDFMEYKAIPISLIILIIGFSYSGLLTFISLYAKEIHLEKAASFYFLVYSGAVLVTRPLSGRLMDIKGANFVVYPCLMLYAAGMLIFSQATAGIMLLAAAVLIAMGYGNFFSCAHAVSIRGIPPHRMGLAITTFFIFVDLGFGIGPYLLGGLVAVTGYRGLYVIMTLVILASIPLYYLLLGRKEIRSGERGPED